MQGARRMGTGSTRWLPLLAACALALAGCQDGRPAAKGDTTDAQGLPLLHGYVVDQSLRPVEGATVRILETGANATTGRDGFFGFDDVPRNELLVLVAEAAGFLPGSKSVRLAPEGLLRLNFTLTPAPTETPSRQVLRFEGLLACQFGATTPGGTLVVPCVQGDGEDVWEFAAEPRLAGAVIEVAWEAASPASRSLGARLETLGLGDQNHVLAEAVGEPVLRLEVPRVTAQKYYASGGHLRLTVFVAQNVDEEEAGSLGAGAAVNQGFEAFASLFYVEGPPPSYTVAG